MTVFKTYPMANSAILRLNSERDFIKVDPWYQRRSDVWTLEKKQLLIDSILNDYDIPKLYFHALSKSQKKKASDDFDFSIIDGRQRLETIWGFIDGKFPISDDFEYLVDDSIQAQSLTYNELSKAYPTLKIRFDSYSLPIMCIETEDIDLIEDMFSRLNEAVPLNAAEKRNAIGGPMAQCIRDVSGHDFFERVKFTDKRYQFREVSARLLFLEFSRSFFKRVIDTKKPYMDDMVRKYKDGDEELPDLGALRSRTKKTLDSLSEVFDDSDDLLRAQAIIPIYYLSMQAATAAGKTKLFEREALINFFENLNVNRRRAEANIAKADFDLLEFDRMSQQGTNDATSIRERVRILCQQLGYKSNISE